MYICIVVAGAGSGIGREVSRVLAREGATVVVTDYNIKKAEETKLTLEGLCIYINHFILRIRKSVEFKVQNQ